MIWDRAGMLLRGVVVAVALALVVPSVALAATVTNTNDSGSGSLRNAIALTASGGTVDFAPGLTGTIRLTGGVLSITQSIDIVGPGASSITIDGNGNTTVFDIAPSVANQDVMISGLTITGGAATTNGGGILANSVLRSLTLSADTISGNQVSISNPAAASGGGGVYINGGALAVTGSTISGNTATLTGANSLVIGGGGIYSNGGAVTIAASTVSGNKFIESGTVSSRSDGGGGIYSNGGDVTITAGTIDGNMATIDAGGGSDGGGGVYSNGGAVTLTADSIDDNNFKVSSSTSGNNGGGGVYSAGGDINDSLSSISDNTADVTSSGDENGGGALYDEGGTSTYSNSTLSGNSTTISVSTGTDNGGGAIFTFGPTTASDLTIAGNRINEPGGALLSEGSFQLKNTILAANTASSGHNCDGSGPFSSSGFNLETGNSCGLTAAGDHVNTDPQLGPLQNNGGPTLTQALPATSPAVDAGSCTDVNGVPVPIDQRGVARPQPAGGKCDIGAFELVPASPPATVPGTPVATSSTGAGFSATVNPEGQVTTVFFQYGIDARYRPGGGTAVIYDQSTPAQTLPADSTPHAVAATASGLVPNALYHVRLVATNATGTTTGPDQTFTTPRGPAPPPPTVGKTVNVAPVSGQVFVLVGGKLVPLTEAQQLPSGAVVDAQNGSIQLTTAAGTGHKRETGTFGGAIFRLTQARAGSARGLTTLSLVEGAFTGAPSYAGCKAHHATDGTAAAASSRTLQLLRASAHGKFSTRGRYSAATVLGTKWTIADRCDGTLVHDTKDAVVVDDFVRHRKIVLHAGQSYLAKAQRHG